MKTELLSPVHMANSTIWDLQKVDKGLYNMALSSLVPEYFYLLGTAEDGRPRSGPLFTKWQDILSSDMAKSWNWIAVKFDRGLGSTAAETPAKFHS